VRPAVAFPVYETRLHYVGQSWLAVTTWGLLGTEGGNRVAEKDRLVLGISYSPSFEFPAGTRSDYLYGGSLYVGGIIGTDTLVSIAMNGESASRDEWNAYDTISESSTLRSSQYYDPSAKAEQQFHVKLYDTLVLNSIDEGDGRRHLPLHLEVSQTTYAWSDQFSRQFVILEYWIRNIGSRAVSKMAMGIYVDADVINRNQNVPDPFNDDISGFITEAPNLANSTFKDPMNMSWVGDNDGDPVAGTFPTFSPRGGVGIRILRAPLVQRFSFNWWLIGGTSAQDWGPVKAGARAPAGGQGLGAPQGDRNIYYVMTNGEIDYGQLEANVNHTSEGWRPKLNSGGCDVADGLDTRQVISCGPTVDPVFPGDSVAFVVAFVGGNPLHAAAGIEFDCTNPFHYINSLDYSALAFGASWSSWVYDNPGVDTDGDGYAGEFHVDSDGEPIYYTGDCGPPPGPGSVGIVYNPPNGDTIDCRDFGKPDAPACPELKIESQPSEIIIRWDGRFTETALDRGTNKIDFEGYKLFLSSINSEELYSLIAQWDVEDYFLVVYDPALRRWITQGDPYSPYELDSLFGVGFNPAVYDTPRLDDDCLKYPVYDPNGDSTFESCAYLSPAFQNRDNEYEVADGGMETNIIQRVGIDTVITNFGEMQIFGKYEAVIDNMNPSVGQYVSVSAFDYGSAKLNIQSLESKRGAPDCTEFAIPIYSADVVERDKLGVSVFPNPYKISFEGPKGKQTTYFDELFEAPEKKLVGGNLDEQDRRIWFINLPSKATIKIFTLDGDLVRQIDHIDPAVATSEGEKSPTTDYSSRAYWDLITRNTQAAVSGIYIYRVDSELGSQIGKLVIIK
jgi:hypothetical protein